MHELVQQDMPNALLRKLDAESFAALSPHLTPVSLVKRRQLATAGQPIERNYFLSSGIASVVAPTPAGQQAEISMIGREGFVHPSTALGTDVSPFDVFMQADGDALAVPTRILLQLSERFGEFRRLLLDYVQVFLVQISHTAVATASLSLRERLARWLVMGHDRVDGDALPMTHEFLSVMLTVRRPGITEAVQALEATGAIEPRRGMIIVRDRARLLEIAGACYGGPEAEYQRLLGGGAWATA